MQNETIRFRFNGNLFQLRIVGCKVYPQGYAAIVQQLADFEGEHLLADIGNGTMNLLYLTDSQPQESRCWTEKIGVNQCMIRAKEAVLRRFGSKISDSTVADRHGKNRCRLSRLYSRSCIRLCSRTVCSLAQLRVRPCHHALDHRGRRWAVGQALRQL